MIQNSEDPHLSMNKVKTQSELIFYSMLLSTKTLIAHFSLFPCPPPASSVAVVEKG